MLVLASFSRPGLADMIPVQLTPDELEGLRALGGGRVVSIIDGDTLVLEGGEEVRLVGTQAPKLPLGRPDFEPWPLGEEARLALEALALGKEVRLHAGGRDRDRHGRTLAHCVTAEGTWLQGSMMQAGLARVYSFADNRSLIGHLYGLERHARTEGTGIWAHPYYAIRRASDLVTLDHDFGTFQLVEGVVESVGRANGLLYINFGQRWSRDFTIVLDDDAQDSFAEAGRDLWSLEGRGVRVRGWIERSGGPMIALSHPEPLEEAGAS